MFGNVPKDAVQPDGPARIVPYQLPPCRHVMHASIAPDHSVVGLVRETLLDGQFQGRPKPFPVRGVDRGVELIDGPREGVRLQTQKSARLVVEIAFVLDNVQVPHAHAGRPEREIETGLAFPQRFFAVPFPGLVAKDHDHADHVTRPVHDGGAAVGNGPLGAVPGDEQGVIRQSDDRSDPEDVVYRVLHVKAGSLVDDAEDFLNRSALRFLLQPAGSLFRAPGSSASPFRRGRW